MTPSQLVSYYSNLLILQYLQKPKAFATIQAISSQAILPQVTTQSVSFSGTAASGSFILNYTPYGGLTYSTAAINWDDSISAIQTKLQAVTSLSSVTVSGSIAAGFTITFTNVVPVVPLLTVASNSLRTAGSVAITITVAETDVTLPIALSNAYNINSTFGPTAVGAQLDVIANYVGVTRTGVLSTGSVTLNDSDFLALIQFAAIKNSAGSDLSTIQSLINQFFAGEILVFDYQNMQMSYLISSSVGSQNLARLLVAEGLLFKPMGVSLSTTTFAPTITTFFGFRTYLINTINNTPFNSYTSYNMSRPWLTYADGVST